MDNILKKVFAIQSEQYLCFHDKDGILKNGLWIFFEQDADDLVFEVLPNKILGDLVLAFSRGTTQCPEHIVGIAFIVGLEPEDYRECVERYVFGIQQNIPVNKYQKQVYSYILDKLSHCTLNITRHLTLGVNQVKSL